MARLAVAMDLGTSGFRAQAIDLSSFEIISTAITTRHPLPGVNVMDHLHFALELGSDIAQDIMIQAANRLIGGLGVPVDQVERLAVCGNPAQLSLFQKIEIRDLAYGGRRKLKSLGVRIPKRQATLLPARYLPGSNLPEGCTVMIPPAVHHEIGADALAMIIQSRMLEKDETSIAIDLGTNAEMALHHKGTVITGSTAAGPALEGQQISCGTLAVPGAISDLEPAFPRHRLILLNSMMLPVKGRLVDLSQEGVAEETALTPPVGITGTGTLSVVHQAMETGLIALPHIRTRDGRLHLGEGLFLSEQDLAEAGKAIGAVRAGQIALCQKAGIRLEDIRTAYLSGASGTYVDAIKAQKLGMIPPGVRTIYQIGNTALAMARDLLADPKNLDRMTALAHELQKSHCLFASSETFKKVYILEFSYWTEGMPMSWYRAFLKKYHFPDWPPVVRTPEIVRTVKRDINDLGPMGLFTIKNIGRIRKMRLEGCTHCLACVKACPGKALSIVSETDPATIMLDESLCNGVACRRCEGLCPVNVLELYPFFRT